MVPALLLATVTATATATSTTSDATTTTATVSAAVVEAPTVRPEDARGYEDEPGLEYREVLLFLPRLVLTPPRWILTAFFWPLRQGLVLVEDTRLVEHIIDLLYNDARTAGIFPTFDVLSSQGASFGARIFHNDLFGHDESLSASFKLGGIVQQAYDLSFETDRLGNLPLWIESQVRWERNPSLYFFGIGDFDPVAASGSGLDPYAVGVETRFAQDRFLGRFRVGTTHGPSDQRVKTGVSLIYNHRRFDDATRLGAGDVSIRDVYDTSLIPGFDDGTSIFEVTGDLVLDFRNQQGQPSDGFYFEAFVGGAPRQDTFEFMHWGAELTTFIELFKDTRVLILHAAIEAVEGARDAIPLAALTRLGGPGRLRGYRVESFRDEKAFVTGAAYHYPIHQYLTGVLFVDAGRVGDAYGELFDVGEWRVGGGGGFRIGSKTTTFIELDLSYGDGFFFYLTTDPFEAFSDRTERL